MNDIDKRLEEIEEYVKFRCGSHPDNVRWLISTLKSEREEKERLERELIHEKASKADILERFDKLENKYEALGGDYDE